MSYDFSQLNDKEFEVLSVDLLSIFLGKRIERFKPGKDAGVDGRFFADTDKEIILQSKHYLKSGYKKLISSIEKEIIKIRKLKPDKYIFVTSLPLSRSNKKEIKKICYPFIKRDDDVFGQEDLNDLISRNPQIEEKHFKLWISSTTVLKRLLNNAISGRSEFEIEQIRNKALRYVRTRSHDDALKILNKNNVIIISGEPGIGKTTLAQNLCLQHVAKDYQFLDIQESLSEAESVYEKGKKQIFYFDDFLGSNYFEAIENKKDSHIVRFIERVKNDRTKRFVLTSRTNILNSGTLCSTVFADNKIRKNEFLLNIKIIGDIEKARILYNHIWHSKLNEDFIDELYRDKRYRDIVGHKNFNPRLIEFITDVDRLPVKASEYWAHILKTLANPRDIWSKCFKIQSNGFVRNLVILTVFNGGRIPEEDLRRSFHEMIRIEELRSKSNTEKDFESVVQLVTKSFLNRNRISNNRNYYSLFNPSIADFILHEYSKNTRKVIDTCKSLYSVKSLKTLLDLTAEKIVPFYASARILDELFTDAFEKGKSYDYLIHISCLFIDKADKKKRKNTIQLLSEIVASPLPIDEFSNFLKLLSKHKQDLNIVDFNFLLDTFKDRSLDLDEIEELIHFLYIHCIENPKIFDELKEQIEDYLYSVLYDMAGSLDLPDYFCYEDQYGGGGEMTVNEESIREEFEDSLLSSIDGLDPYLLSKLDLDISSMAGQIDIEEMVAEYFQEMHNQARDYIGTRGSDFKDLDDDIDDLFARS